MIGQKSCVGRSARQCCFTSGRVSDVTVGAISFENAPDVANVVHEAGNDEMRIITGKCGNEKGASLHDVLPGQRHEHRVLDVVIEGVAVTRRVERKPGYGWNELSELRMQGSELCDSCPRRETSPAPPTSIREP